MQVLVVSAVTLSCFLFLCLKKREKKTFEETFGVSFVKETNFFPFLFGAQRPSVVALCTAQLLQTHVIQCDVSFLMSRMDTQ